MVDLGRVKEFNRQLKQRQSESSQLRAEIDYKTNEMQKLCQQLSVELGREVTLDNVEEIHNELVEKINSTLQTGEGILARIKQQEDALNGVQPMAQQQMAQQQMAQQQMAQQQMAQQQMAQQQMAQQQMAQQQMAQQPTVPAFNGFAQVQVPTAPVSTMAPVVPGMAVAPQNAGDVCAEFLPNLFGNQ